MSTNHDRPVGPMLPTDDSYLDFVAMNNEMTGAFPAVTDKSRDTYGRIYNELYGLPLGAGDEQEWGEAKNR